MARFYVEHNGEWNIFSTIVDDFLLDEFVCIDALKARLLYERFKELTEDIDSLMTDRPKVNVMPYEEAVRIADRKTENSSEKPNNCEECKHWNDTEDGCADRHECRATTEDWQDWKDKMWSEAVVTEPQTEREGE